uniref:DDE Tnp4 domain-containing protein n=1 Tax=Cajanus cajan TaxID=3821 RepID=A0A151RM09_CAJCA|nr:hypothetical protein KK1_034967 [Cajanus cajan]
MLMGVVTWYHNNYFVKEPTYNWELEWRSFLNHLYRGAEKDCIEQLRLSNSAFFKLCRILQERKCVGALDRTHIPVTVSLEDRPKYCNRKGDVSTIVLATCGPDLRFIYALPGWEGSVGDSRVLRDALFPSCNFHFLKFGILKKRWSILRTPSFFDIKTQIRNINACFVLYNFIRDEQQIDQL